MIWILCFLWLVLPEALGNTEIVNFEATKSPEVALPHIKSFPVLTIGQAEQAFHVSPAAHSVEHAGRGNFSLGLSHELWLVLDLDANDWLPFSKFTLRISWPACSPADFSVDVYAPEDFANLFLGHNVSQESAMFMTRQKIAHITLHDSAIFTPSSSPPILHAEPQLPDPVPFIVLLEPLYLGVLPASVLPVVGLLTAVIAFAALAVLPLAQRWIFAVARQVPVELAVISGLESK